MGETNPALGMNKRIKHLPTGAGICPSTIPLLHQHRKCFRLPPTPKNTARIASPSGKRQFRGVTSCFIHKSRSTFEGSKTNGSVSQRGSLLIPTPRTSEGPRNRERELVSAVSCLCHTGLNSQGFSAQRSNQGYQPLAYTLPL